MEISQTSSSAIRYLEALRRLGPSTLDQLSAEIGELLATSKRRLLTLEQHGMVRLGSDLRWRLGPALLHLAAHAPDPLVSLASGPIRRLAERVSGTVVLARCRPPYFEIVWEQDGRSGPLRFENYTGVKMEMWQAPPGLAFVASLTSEQRDEIRARADNPAVVDEALQQLTTRGRVVLPSVLVTGRVGVSVPIVIADPPATIGSLTVSISDESEDHTSVIVDLLLETVNEIVKRVPASRTDLLRDRHDPLSVQVTT